MSLGIDPRTQLPIVPVPESLFRAGGASGLQGCLIHWVGRVKKTNSQHKMTEKILVLGDAALYLTGADGSINRCVRYEELKDLLLKDEDCSVGFRNDSSSEVDVLVTISGSPTGGNGGGKAEHLIVADIVKKIYWTHMGLELPVTTLHPAENMAVQCRLNRPSGWCVRIEPMRKIGYLQKLLQDFKVTNMKQEERVHQEFTRIKQELVNELERKRNTQYDRMMRQMLEYVARVKTLESENTSLRHQLDRLEPYLSGHEQEAAASYYGGDQHHENDSPTSRPGPPPKPSPLPGSMTGADDLHSGGIPGCARCAEMESLLEQHPNIDKKRILQAEEDARGLQQQVEKLNRDLAPLQEEIKKLRKVCGSVDHILRDQSLQPNERVRAGLEVTSPAAFGSSVGGPASNLANESELRNEIDMLRGLLRDSSVYHTAELKKLKQSFVEYDQEMVKVVKQSLEQQLYRHGGAGESGADLSRMAQGVVVDSKESITKRKLGYATSPAEGETQQLKTAADVPQPQHGGGSILRGSSSSTLGSSAFQRSNNNPQVQERNTNFAPKADQRYDEASYYENEYPQQQPQRQYPPAQYPSSSAPPPQQQQQQYYDQRHHQGYQSTQQYPASANPFLNGGSSQPRGGGGGGPSSASVNGSIRWGKR